MQMKNPFCFLALMLAFALTAAAAASPNVVVAPKTGELWHQTTNCTIIWSGPPAASIFLLKDGAPFREIFTGATAPLNGLWSYVWKIGIDVPLGAYQIRVQQMGNPTVSATGPIFWVTGAKTEVAITDINFRYYKAGAPATFKWRYSAIPTPPTRLASFTIRDPKSGLTYTLATFPLNGKSISNSPDGFGAATATIPANIPEINDSTLKLTVFAPGLPDTVTAVIPFFRIEPAVAKPQYQGITLTNPATGAKLYQGTTSIISWKYDPNLTGTVSVKCLNGLTIASRIPIGSGGQGSCEWKIGYSQAQGSICSMVVQHDTMNPIIASSHVDAFVLPQQNPFIITSPAAGSYLEPGQKLQLKWLPKAGTAPVKTAQIDLTTNGGGFGLANTYALKADGSGSLDIQLPLSVHNTTVVGPAKIEIYNHECPYSNSAVAFNVHPTPTVTITSPALNSGTKFYTNEIRTITWNYTGYKPGLKTDLVLKWAGGSQSRVIATGLAMPGTGGQGSYNWPIPGDLETRNDYQIHITYGGETRGGASGTREVAAATIVAIELRLKLEKPPVLKLP